MSGLLHVHVRGTNRSIDLTEGVRVTAGRAPDCDIQIEDQSVSRHHLSLLRRGEEIEVADLESANGTFVNERQVPSGWARAGDLVRLGTTVLEVREGSAGARTGRLPRMGGDASTIESVISRRIEPSRFDWLSAVPSAGAELALLQRAQRHLETLHHVSELLAAARDLQGLSDATLRAILDVTDADRTAIVLRRAEPDGGAEVAAARSRLPGPADFTVSRTLVADVIEKGISVFAHDASADERFAAGQSVIGQHVRSVMCVPLRTTDEILGAIYVDSLSGAGRFTDADLELLAAIGNQAGVALHRVRLLSEIERLLFDTIRAIAATIDAKDGYTHRHSERVAALSKRIAAELGLSEDEQETVELSALLHDVGKIAVPDSILNKPERLTTDEYAEMKKHPLHGARILANIQSAAVKAVVPGVQYHHERWDGTGYPEGLVADAIPLVARVLGVSDFLDALTSARAYRGAMPVDEVVGLIKQNAGTHFDPAVADVVVRLHERGELLPDDWES